jgi:hypothetical protein
MVKPAFEGKQEREAAPRTSEVQRVRRTRREERWFGETALLEALKSKTRHRLGH